MSIMANGESEMLCAKLTGVVIKVCSAGNRPCQLCQGTTCGTSHTKQGLLQCVVLFIGSRIWPECQCGTIHQIAAAG